VVVYGGISKKIPQKNSYKEKNILLEIKFRDI
jgi:hypothetical protein